MRQEAIEAMATKLEERWIYEDYIDASQVALDALLDYLEASADEWIEAEFTAARQNDPLIVVPLRKVDTSSLLSVLREDT
jgi:hypothetical protein